MKPYLVAGRRKNAFTLIELLVVIAIIGILAALIAPAVAIAMKKAKVARARTEIADLVNAIERYHSTYGRYPVDNQAMESVHAVPANQGGPEDFTYGATFPDGLMIRAPGTYQATNDQLVAILMDITEYPGDAPIRPTVNFNNVKNTQKIKFLNARRTDDETMPGVGPDLVYRDPWSNPYIVSLDLNFDEKTRDALYRRRAVSQESGSKGFNGLINTVDVAKDFFEFNGGVMVWSLGPDRKASLNSKARETVNADNVLSWK